MGEELVTFTVSWKIRKRREGQWGKAGAYSKGGETADYKSEVLGHHDLRRMINV